ncbi:uncharacterized protein BXIN_1000 [Babesia sp. Xinjiang]|uniref:uncharacterized protein n=1 Tax=Babesia sp. Xinjiang TaxID=462227 RepID=UPI000A24EB6A|nr:uncharacterized protein BXIN_1000 [Babesia sp. Xinjiang]ORM42215.1 hypothetical protein BXIN_1000 [Babesia sp. Xinjiang]
MCKITVEEHRRSSRNKSEENHDMTLDAYSSAHKSSERRSYRRRSSSTNTDSYEKSKKASYDSVTREDRHHDSTRRAKRSNRQRDDDDDDDDDDDRHDGRKKEAQYRSERHLKERERSRERVRYSSIESRGHSYDRHGDRSGDHRKRPSIEYRGDPHHRRSYKRRNRRTDGGADESKEVNGSEAVTHRSTNAVDRTVGAVNMQSGAGTTTLLKRTIGERTDVSLDILNHEFRELNYAKAYGIDITGFVGVQADILKVETQGETKPMSNYQRRQLRKEEILKHPDRFWKCNRCGYMNYLSNYECTGCQQLRNANR